MKHEHGCSKQRWRETWHHHGGLRGYYGARLHRRLFVWFGITIFLTLMVVSVVGGRGAEFRPRLRWLVPSALVLWVLSGKIARRISRPLSELVEMSNEIGRGKLAARAPLDRLGYGEVAILGRSMNDMAARIEKQLKDQRELLAGVSHELRTPLARMRVLFEIARERGPNASTWDELERELLEVDCLVGELLASARLDFQALASRPLDAVEGAARALERAGLPADKLVAEAGGLPGPAPVSLPFVGDPTLVGRALANLLDNAAKHGRGLDRLRVSGRPGLVVFEFEDRGPGLPAGFETRVFEPFVQGTGDGAGLGLGLALVARIARAHGGRVSARNRPEGGAVMTLELAAGDGGSPQSSSSSRAGAQDADVTR